MAPRAVELIRERGFDVVGNLDDLLTPDEPPDRRHPDTVTEAEVAEVAVDLVAILRKDIRRLTRELRTLSDDGPAPHPSSPGRGLSALLAKSSRRPRGSEGASPR